MHVSLTLIGGDYVATPIDLLRRYREIIESPIDPSNCESGECLSILFNSEWVTILVTRSPEMDGFCFIEVEVSFPVCAIEPTPSSSSAKQKEARVFTCALIAHLNYLLRLQDYGFTLGIISTEGIWSAVIEIEKALEVPFFETIIPP